MSYWLLTFSSIGFSLISFLTLKFIYNFKSKQCSSKKRLDGKVVVITGASSGIGKYAAIDIAKRGPRVILACRNEVKTLEVIKEITKATGNSDLKFYHLDTSDLSSVRKCGENILKNETRVDILINNAGTVGTTKRCLTSDGLEFTMATNHYGHFLLTNILLGKMIDCSPSRIINVSSLAHKMCNKLDPEDLNFEKLKYSSFSAYAQSKLCNVLFTLELSKKLQRTGVTANSIHPGLVDTEIFGKSNTLIMQLAKYAVPFLGKTPEIGAQTIIHVAVSEEVDRVSGKYFDNCQEGTALNLGTHYGLAQKLWLASELDVKLEDNEIHYQIN